MKNYLKLIRVKHWLKNALIFLPIFFSGNILDEKFFLKGLLAFFIFSISSSIVYVINDLQDIEKDRNHPEKKKRPLASGAIKVSQAIGTIIVLAIISVSLMFYAHYITHNIFVILIPLLYIFLNILYSFYLKHIPIIDVVILVSGFLLRVMYGGVITEIEVSKYLYLMIIFGAFYLGFGKRRNEIIKNGKKSRKVLELYNKDFLDKNMYVALTLAVASYSLWCLDPSTIARIGNDYVFWTIPIIIIILQLYSLNIEGDSHGDPIEVVLHDKSLIIMIIVYVIVMSGVLYL